MAEAWAIADGIDHHESACACVLGFGAGYHCRALAERWGREGVVLCFEPDVGLLRAVLERLDCAEWISRGHVAILTDPDDSSAVVAAAAGVQPLVLTGLRRLEHPSSRGRLAGQSERFTKSFADAIASLRTTIMTTLVMARTSLRNEMMHAPDYAVSDGIASLVDLALDRPAIVVSGGPSLARNIHELARPGVRDRFVIIAATTVLKPLLAAGVRPHFVCTLDYGDLGRRFVEGLTAADVEGVTLVVEPKGNAAMTKAWPGALRFLGSGRLDDLLGRAAGMPKGSLESGATVAHMCYALARYLGADPVILVGQDLGFTDGQYYAANAAIHGVWASELNEFNTLEMMEWQRIARNGRTLRQATDVLGRPCYTDEQMLAYAQQFEVSFAKDAKRGARTIDATEGGILKRHTEIATLAEAIDEHWADDPIEVPLPTGARSADQQLGHLRARLEKVVEDCARFDGRCEETIALLDELAETTPGSEANARTVREVLQLRDEVMEYKPTYELIQFISQNSQFRRLRADRRIRLAAQSEDGLEGGLLQERQRDRDVDNVRLLRQGAGEVGALARHTLGVLDGERPVLCRRFPITDAAEADGAREPADVALVADAGRIGVVVCADPEIGGLGCARDLTSPVHDGRTALDLTLARLRRASRVDEVVVVSGDPERTRRIAGASATDPRVVFTRGDAGTIRHRARAVGVGRLWSAACWRGGLGGLTAYDESLHPGVLHRAMEERSLAAAVVVGADWCLVDPALIDGVIERYQSEPEDIKIAFTQAAPGLGGFLLRRDIVKVAADGVGDVGAHASIGGILTYHPRLPQQDPIARDYCLNIPTEVRDCGLRLVAEDETSRSSIGRVIDELGGGWLDADAAPVVEAAQDIAGPGIRELVVEPCTGRVGGGVWGERLRAALNPEGIERGPVDPEVVRRAVAAIAESRPDVAVTIHGVGDPLLHPHPAGLVAAAREGGAAGVHVRTDGLAGDAGADTLLGLGADVVSVDVLAASPEVHRVMTGTERYEAVRDAVNDAAKRAHGGLEGLPSPWIAARITRCDEVYEDIETFHLGWIASWVPAVIDPPVGPIEGGRIQPLPMPTSARQRIAASRLVMRSDGSIEGLEDVGPVVWELGVGAIARRLRAGRHASPTIATRAQRKVAA